MEAEELCRSALRCLELSLGPRHPNVIVARNNLADLLRCQGKLDDAVQVHKHGADGLSPELVARASNFDGQPGAMMRVDQHWLSNMDVRMSAGSSFVLEPSPDQRVSMSFDRVEEIGWSPTYGIVGRTGATDMQGQRHHGMFPFVSRWDEDAKVAASKKGVLQRADGIPGEAPTVWQKIEVWQKGLEPRQLDDADMLLNHGTVLLQQGNSLEALSMLRRGVQVCKSRRGEMALRLRCKGAMTEESLP